MSAPIAKGLVLALIVAYYGLGLVGALGNRNWLLLAWLCAPLAYIAGSELVRRRSRPAVVPAEQERG
jgi:hypothetical protein